MPFWAAPVRGKTVSGDIEPVEGSGAADSGSADQPMPQVTAQASQAAGGSPDPVEVDWYRRRDEESGEVPPVNGNRSNPFKAKGVPQALSREEYGRHCVTHFPYRPWCRHCVFGAGRRGRHVSVQSGAHDIPVISIDYGFLPRGITAGSGGDSGGQGSESAPQQEEEHSSPFLVCTDSAKGTLLSEFVPAKGEDAYAVERLTEHLTWLGHAEFRF